MFCVAGDHVHLVLAGSRREAGHCVSGLVRALVHVPPGAAFEPSRVRPVADERHLVTLVDYVLAQPFRHRLSATPAAWTGSCFQDLVGARRLPGYDGGLLRQALPLWRSEESLEAVCLPALPTPLSEERLAGTGLARILTAAGAAFAAPPGLRGQSTPSVRAKRVAATLALAAGYPAAAVASRLGCSRPQVRRLVRRRAPGEDLVVVRRQLDLQELVSGRRASRLARRRTSERGRPVVHRQLDLHELVGDSLSEAA